MVRQAHHERFSRKVYSINNTLKTPIQGNYNFEHLTKIHQYLFEGLREYAGQLRRIEPFFKQNEYDVSLATIFADVDEILPTIDEMAQFLKENHYLKYLNHDDFVYEFAVSYAEFNFAHPFEEGNGRATRILFKQLAQEAGYEFDTSHITKQAWDAASMLSCEHGVIYELGNGRIEIEPNDDRDINPLIDIMHQCLVRVV